MWTLLIDPAISAALTFSLAALFAASAVHKARAYREFVGVIGDYRIAPQGAAALIAPVLLAAEAAIAACLFVPALRSVAALAGAGLLIVYGGSIAFNLLRGRRDIDCGCTFGATADRLTWSLVMRNAALAGAALAAASPAGLRELGLLDFITIGVAVIAGGVFYLTAETLRVNAVKFVLAGYR
ncbi:MAG: MauE/DoxX family redox-associated membrane protein [Parvularculaceae bacterium]|nr:hypothetical protein [Parvularculaceae bacterium]